MIPYAIISCISLLICGHYINTLDYSVQSPKEFWTQLVLSSVGFVLSYVVFLNMIT